MMAIVAHRTEQVRPADTVMVTELSTQYEHAGKSASQACSIAGMG